MLLAVLAVATGACRAGRPVAVPADTLDTPSASGSATVTVPNAGVAASPELARDQVVLDQRSSVSDFCVRARRGDVIMQLEADDDDVEPPNRKQLYRAAFDANGQFGPVVPFFDLAHHVGAVGSAATIRAFQCHPSTDRVLVTLGAGGQLENDRWTAELWLLDPDGLPMTTDGLAADIRPVQVALSPDGSWLLLVGTRGPLGGIIHRLETSTRRSGPIEGVVLSGPAGSGQGWLHWSADGRFGLAESFGIRPDGALLHMDHFVDVIDATASPAAVVASRVLTNAISVAVVSEGLVYLASPPVDPHGPYSSDVVIVHWDPAQPEREPLAVGAFRRPGDPIEGVSDIFVVSSAASMSGDSEGQNDRWRQGQLVFSTPVERRSALFLATVGDEGVSLTRLTPDDVGIVRAHVGGRVLVYQVGASKASQEVSVHGVEGTGRRLGPGWPLS